MVGRFFKELLPAVLELFYKANFDLLPGKVCNKIVKVKLPDLKRRHYWRNTAA
jgi:hypothetical protein